MNTNEQLLRDESTEEVTAANTLVCGRRGCEALVCVAIEHLDGRLEFCGLNSPRVDRERAVITVQPKGASVENGRRVDLLNLYRFAEQPPAGASVSPTVSGYRFRCRCGADHVIRADTLRERLRHEKSVVLD